MGLTSLHNRMFFTIGSRYDTSIIPRIGKKKNHLYKTVFSSSTGDRLSSPRMKRAGPKGLRAESARAVTGRRCPNSGKGEDFLTGPPDFFTETAVTLMGHRCSSGKGSRHERIVQFF